MFKAFPRALAVAALTAAAAVTVSAQEIQQEGPVATTATIMVDSKTPVQLNPNQEGFGKVLRACRPTCYDERGSFPVSLVSPFFSLSGVDSSWHP